MRRIIDPSLRFRLLVVAIAAGVIAVGVVQLRDAPVDVLPEFTPPYVEVQTEALGLSAEEVEQLVTVPLAVAGSIPGHEIEHPMAVVILGGLVTSTLLNLFVLPSLYLRFGKARASRVQEA